MKFCCTNYWLLSNILIIFIFSSDLFCQTNTDTLRGRNLYRPNAKEIQDTLTIADSVQIPSQAYLDSIADVKYKHMLDSIAAREIFVRDSIARRQHILDSLNMIRAQLPRLLESALKTYSDNIILSSNPIQIVGDSMLSNYVSNVLIMTTDQPYTPWLKTINLSDKPVKLTLDEKSQKIIGIQSPDLSAIFQYTRNPNILKLAGNGIIASTRTGKVYKSPVDSVFFDNRGRIIKVKRYTLFSQVVNNYKQGALIYTELTQVKQYQYDPNNQLSSLQLVNFCDRKTANDPEKVCYMITYTIARQGNNYTMTRKTDPANEFADGTVTYEYDNSSALKSISFTNFKGTENRKTYLELNEAGYVNNYIYEIKGKINNSLLINYYLNDPKAKNKIELISCTFEDDGVSYYQKNNTTGKSRVRDHLTMEWSDWR